MIIKKKLNNNVAVVLDNIGKETIVMGKGIAFDKKAGDHMPEDIVEKRFVLSSQDVSVKFQEILMEIPAKYLTVSDEIIEKAKSDLSTELNENLYITLTDHIYMAVKRFLEGIEVPNPMLWDIRHFYQKEFRVGEAALGIIRQKLKVELPEDEAGFIAFHLVNAQKNWESTVMVDIMKMVREITNIIKYQVSIDFDEESVYYYRFITHLKFFAQRLFSGKPHLTDEKNPLFEIVKEKYQKAFGCTESIISFVMNKYNYCIAEEEQLYLTVHIQNIIEKSRK